MTQCVLPGAWNNQDQPYATSSIQLKSSPTRCNHPVHTHTQHTKQAQKWDYIHNSDPVVLKKRCSRLPDERACVECRGGLLSSKTTLCLNWPNTPDKFWSEMGLLHTSLRQGRTLNTSIPTSGVQGSNLCVNQEWSECPLVWTVSLSHNQVTKTSIRFSCDSQSILCGSPALRLSCVDLQHCSCLPFSPAVVHVSKQLTCCTLKFR